MKPYLIGIDRTNPIGKLIGDYGYNQWLDGFIIGLVSGSCLGGIAVWALVSKR